MQITSSAFADQGQIPLPHVMPGAGGRNISLPLAWTGVPEGTRSLALSLVDPHPVARNWVHWLVINIPPQVTALEAGASGVDMPAGTVELRNSFGQVGYGGPQPPPGSGDHPYVFTLFALNEAHLSLPVHISLGDFLKALEGKRIATATLTGYFGR